MLKILGYLIRFWPLLSLAVRIIEEAGDENGWSGEEKKRHALEVVEKLAAVFHITLPEGFKATLGALIETVVALFNMLGIFRPAAEKPEVAVNRALARAPRPIVSLEEAERIAREEFRAIEEKNAARGGGDG